MEFLQASEQNIKGFYVGSEVVDLGIKVISFLHCEVEINGYYTFGNDKIKGLIYLSFYLCITLFLTLIKNLSNNASYYKFLIMLVRTICIHVLLNWGIFS